MGISNIRTQLLYLFFDRWCFKPKSWNWNKFAVPFYFVFTHFYGIFIDRIFLSPCLKHPWANIFFLLTRVVRCTCDVTIAKKYSSETRTSGRKLSSIEWLFKVVIRSQGRGSWYWMKVLRRGFVGRNRLTFYDAVITF